MKTYFRLRSFRVELWKKNPLPNQELILFDLIQNMKYTEWGKTHDYENIKMVDLLGGNGATVEHHRLEGNEKREKEEKQEER